MSYREFLDLILKFVNVIETNNFENLRFISYFTYYC